MGDERISVNLLDATGWAVQDFNTSNLVQIKTQ